jgi:uncharacterized protein (UPF0276 family)
MLQIIHIILISFLVIETINLFYELLPLSHSTTSVLVFGQGIHLIQDALSSSVQLEEATPYIVEASRARS